MTVPSQMSVRPYPRALRVRVRVCLAVGWEALVETHTAQALQFIGEFANRVSPLDALDLYLRVVGAPAPMHEPIRARTLSRIDLDCLPDQAVLPRVAGWRLLRLDLIVEMLRYRRRYHAKTYELARMVGARAAEAIAATHVNNALELARLLYAAMSVDRAVTEYIRAFYLPLGMAQVVMQRVKAAVAGEQLAAQYAHQARLDADWQDAGGDDPSPARLLDGAPRLS